jgi:tRNA (guanine26-N2/guanine27-N2)-dimethyltransferase
LDHDCPNCHFPAAPEGYSIVTEGKANILFPEGNQVFYNPAQEVNRDLSIMMIKMFQQELKKEKETRNSVHLKF